MLNLYKVSSYEKKLSIDSYKKVNTQISKTYGQKYLYKINNNMQRIIKYYYKFKMIVIRLDKYKL